jgi:hypothetical protein
LAASSQDLSLVPTNSMILYVLSAIAPLLFNGYVKDLYPS